MKHRYRLLVTGLGVVALAVALALVTPWGQDSVSANGTIHYVDADATTGGNNGSSWADAFLELQDALDAAVSGDQIWVAEGTYKPTAEHGGTGDRYKSFQMKNGVAIYGGFDPTVGDIAWEDRDWEANPTILSGDLNGDDGPDFANSSENSYHVFYHPSDTGMNDTAILDGFTITGGSANGADIHSYGGGMYNDRSSPTVNNCIFSHNSAGNGHGGGMYNANGSSPALTDCTFAGNSSVGNFGGGMANSSSSPTLVNCAFVDNSAYGDGGGMANFYSSPTLTNCTFARNSAAFFNGGGMYNLYSSPTLTNCAFEGNWVYFGSGGGMYNVYSSPTLADCTFEGNSADYGGGMYNNSSLPTLTHCIFLENSALDSGGGMWNSNGSSAVLTDCNFSSNSADYGGGMNNSASSPVLTNCIFAGNSANAGNGGGMYNWDSSSPVLTNCTFSGNSAGSDGGGVFNHFNSSAALTNSILWGNSPNQISNDSSTPVVTYCDVQGGYSGEGNIDEDPLFVDAADGDYHLGPDSPCIDVGNNDAPELPGLDFEREPRILDGDDDGIAIVDMGVDEVAVGWPQSRIYLPVVLRGY